MARGVNKVILIGGLGRDPEIRYMPNGNAVVNLSLATDESYKDKNTGQKVDKTEWHRIVAYNKLAEIMGEYLKKGSKIYIEGKLQTREWEKDGIKRYSTEIIANDMKMLDSKNEQSQAPQAGQQPRQNQPPQYTQAPNAQQVQAGNYQTQPPGPHAGNPTRPDHGGYQPQQSAPQPPQQPMSQGQQNGMDDFDSDIPF